MRPWASLGQNINLKEPNPASLGLLVAKEGEALLGANTMNAKEGEALLVAKHRSERGRSPLGVKHELAKLRFAVTSFRFVLGPQSRLRLLYKSNRPQRGLFNLTNKGLQALILIWQRAGGSCLPNKCQRRASPSWGKILFPKRGRSPLGQI